MLLFPADVNEDRDPQLIKAKKIRHYSVFNPNWSIYIILSPTRTLQSLEMIGWVGCKVMGNYSKSLPDTAKQLHTGMYSSCDSMQKTSSSSNQRKFQSRKGS